MNTNTNKTTTSKQNNNSSSYHSVGLDSLLENRKWSPSIYWTQTAIWRNDLMGREPKLSISDHQFNSTSVFPLFLTFFPFNGSSSFVCLHLCLSLTQITFNLSTIANICLSSSCLLFAFSQFYSLKFLLCSLYVFYNLQLSSLPFRSN